MWDPVISDAKSEVPAPNPTKPISISDMIRWYHSSFSLKHSTAGDIERAWTRNILRRLGLRTSMIERTAHHPRVVPYPGGSGGTLAAAARPPLHPCVSLAAAGSRARQSFGALAAAGFPLALRAQRRPWICAAVFPAGGGLVRASVVGDPRRAPGRRPWAGGGRCAAHRRGSCRGGRIRVDGWPVLQLAAGATSRWWFWRPGRRGRTWWCRRFPTTTPSHRDGGWCRGHLWRFCGLG
jgi:hypothetical protein